MKVFIFTLFLVLILFVPGHAESHPTSVSKPYTPYLGIGVGGYLLTPTIKFSSSWGTQQTTHDQYSGVLNELFFGVEKDLESHRWAGGKVFLAQQLFGGVQSPHYATSFGNNFGSQRFELEQKHTFGIAAHYGTYITPFTQLYGGLNLSYTMFNLRHIIDIGGFVFGIGREAQRGLIGAGPLVGLRTNLTGPLEFYVEGSYVMYQTWKYSSSFSYQGTQYTATHSLTPCVFSVMGGILFKF